jgi:hypothetical protein
MRDPELFTIEDSHGRPRLTAPRLSDVGTVPSASEPSPDRAARGRFAPGNQAAKGSHAKRAVTRQVRDARRRVEEAIRDAVDPSEADQLMADAWAVYCDAKRDVGHRSILVVAPAVHFASNTILAGYFKNAATASGLKTEEAERLLGLAWQCEQQALRASTAMLANAKALNGKRGRESDFASLVAAASKPRGAE